VIIVDLKKDAQTPTTLNISGSAVNTVESLSSPLRGKQTLILSYQQRMSFMTTEEMQSTQ